MEETVSTSEREKSSLQLIIFDMDGLLIDSEPLWLLSRKEILQQFRQVYTPEDKKKVMGTDYEVGVQMLIDEYNLPITVGEFSEMEVKILDNLFEKKLRFMPGAKEFLDRVDAVGIPKAIATSSNRHRLNLTNRVLGLDDFDASVTGEEIKKGKPEPNIYLAAAEKLGIEPDNCLALEDAPGGVKAAKAAGMVTVAVLDTRYSTADDFKGDAEPDLLVNSLEELDIDQLKGLFK